MRIINKEEPPQPPPNVPIYGQVTLDVDEIACCNLGPKFTDYPILSQDGPGSPVGAQKIRKRICCTLRSSRNLQRMTS